MKCTPLIFITALEKKIKRGERKGEQRFRGKKTEMIEMKQRLGAKGKIYSKYKLSK